MQERVTPQTHANHTFVCCMFCGSSPEESGTVRKVQGETRKKTELFDECIEEVICVVGFPRNRPEPSGTVRNRPEGAGT